MRKIRKIAAAIFAAVGMVFAVIMVYCIIQFLMPGDFVQENSEMAKLINRDLAMYANAMLNTGSYCSFIAGINLLLAMIIRPKSQTAE